MTEWWQMPADKMAADQGAIEERHLAYFNTFMVEGDGMHVYCDIRREIYDEILRKPDDMSASEHAIGCRYLLCMLNLIRMKCGVVDELEVIRAEASAAANYQPKKETEKDFEDIYEGV